MVKDKYDGVTTSVSTIGREPSEFAIIVDLPYLFALVMDELTKCIQGEVPWCMLFAVDVVLIDETR